ncbi:hypothetical protein LFX25_03815 [Leptospira sp. FAT2]|uniref:hypothetical protein n=1 Tax=Leptospira sanjuanensis TaxID=2879643 RepID=UPI001EE8C986|nr:hypothetical protein [Leptospira sanjuanensis]MCG6192364.1 hypothetical protein [Leptospira sanjuanensis]
MFKNILLNFVLSSLSMFFFRCDTPKEISETEFKNLIREASKSRSSDELRFVEYLGVADEKAILKVSASAGSKRNKEEFFFTKATPNLISWIDENLFGITSSNFTKLYKYLFYQTDKQFKFEQWTILTRDDSGKKKEDAAGEKTIRITVDGLTVFIFYLRSDEITSFSLNIKHAPNDKEALKYKKLWSQLLNHIQKEEIR